MQQHIFEYFNSEVHTGLIKNVNVTFTDKTDSQNPEKNEKLLDLDFKEHGTLRFKYS